MEIYILSYFQMSGFSSCLEDSRALISIKLPMNIKKDITCSFFDASMATKSLDLLSLNENIIYFESDPIPFATITKVNMLHNINLNNGQVLKIQEQTKDREILIMELVSVDKLRFMKSCNKEISLSIGNSNPFKTNHYSSKDILVPTVGKFENSSSVVDFFGLDGGEFECQLSHLIPVVPKLSSKKL